MTLRIVDAELQLEQGYQMLRASLEAWAGGRADVWQKDGRDGPRADGASFAKREDVYLAIERDPREIAFSAALTEKDRVLVRIELPRREPAKERKRALMAFNDAGEHFLLVSVDELKRQNIRDPFKRLAAAPQIKRANISDRDYVLIGPLNDPKCADALLSLAALHPDFEKHVERLGQLAARSDAADDADVYTVSPRVAREHRVHAKVVDALFERLRGAGFQVADLRNGPIRADFAVHRGDMAIAFEIRADAELEDFVKAIGQLVLVAPRGAGFRRVMVLPAPREALGGVLAPFEEAFRETGVLAVMYEFEGRAVKLWAQIVPPDFPAEIRALFD